MNAAERDRVIAEVFYNKREGFGSLQATYASARRVDPRITKQDVRRFLMNQEVRQRRKPIKVNSYVPDLPREQFQVDLMDMGARAAPRYGFVAMDIFTKKVFVKPIATKDQAHTAVDEMFEALGHPTEIMLDEGGEFKGRFKQEVEQESVQILMSRTGGRFVERMIRTLKKPIYERMQALGIPWTEALPDVVAKYNETKHAMTNATPDDLTEAGLTTDMLAIRKAHKSMESKAKFPVKHEAVQVGDSVKIRIKPRNPKDWTRETFESWSSQVYRVAEIIPRDGTEVAYRLQGYTRPLLRYEIKKIDDVQVRDAAGGVRSVLAERSRAPRDPDPSEEQISALESLRNPSYVPSSSSRDPPARQGLRSAPVEVVSAGSKPAGSKPAKEPNTPEDDRIAQSIHGFLREVGGSMTATALESNLRRERKGLLPRGLYLMRFLPRYPQLFERVGTISWRAKPQPRFAEAREQASNRFF